MQTSSTSGCPQSAHSDGKIETVHRPLTEDSLTSLHDTIQAQKNLGKRMVCPRCFTCINDRAETGTDSFHGRG
jgi:hypothetical protein